MQAVVLAGGMGRSIKAELGDTPKPMVIVNARPLLEFVLLFLKENAIEDVIISGAYMRPVIESYFGDGSDWDLRIKYTNEDFLRGSAGAVKLAEDQISEQSFLVLNGDTYHDVPVYDLIESHLRNDAYVTMALKETDHPELYNAVELDEENRVKRFYKTGHKAEKPLVNTGVYIFSHEALKLIQSDEFISLENDIFPLLAKLGKLYGFKCAGEYLDIEVPENYEAIKDNLAKFVEGE